MAFKEIDTERAGKSVTLGEVEIEPIEHVVVRVEHVSGMIIGVASKVPVAVVIRSPGRTWRVDFDDGSQSIFAGMEYATRSQQAPVPDDRVAADRPSAFHICT